MKKALLITLALMAMTAPMQAQDDITLHPDSVFTIKTTDVTGIDPFARLDVAGTWQVTGAAVDAQATSFKGKLAKPIAKSKLKSKLNKAFKKMKLTSRLSRITLNDDGTFVINLLAKKVTGTFDYDPVDEQLTLRWKGIVPLKMRAKRDGKKLLLLMPTDKLLQLVSLLSDWTKNKTVKQLTMLHDNYDDVLVGFEMKAVKP